MSDTPDYSVLLDHIGHKVIVTNTHTEGGTIGFLVACETCGIPLFQLPLDSAVNRDGRLANQLVGMGIKPSLIEDIGPGMPDFKNCYSDPVSPLTPHEVQFVVGGEGVTIWLGRSVKQPKMTAAHIDSTLPRKCPHCGEEQCFFLCKGSMASTDTLEPWDRMRYNSAIRMLESILLGHTYAGLNVTEGKYEQGVENALHNLRKNHKERKPQGRIGK